MKMKRGKKRNNRIFVWIFIAVIAFVILIAILFGFEGLSNNNIALISIKGTIIAERSGFIPYAATYSDDVVSHIKDATNNKNIKAIVFEINSPGGSAVASSEIAEAIKKAKKEKLTVAVIREQGTSGAYWVASACDHIIAHSLSFTGSIGVIASYLEISGLLKSYNITYEKLTSGEHKDIMTPFRELTEEEREMIQERLDIIYEAFIEEVATNRNLNEQQVRELATGMFYLGKEAKDFGLVDELGTKEDAIIYIEKELDIKASIKEYKEESSFFDLFSRIQSEQSYWIGRGIGASLLDRNMISNLNIKA